MQSDLAIIQAELALLLLLTVALETVLHEDRFHFRLERDRGAKLICAEQG
jgi:hypothetical protein